MTEITSVELADAGLRLPPIEEFTSPEQWLLTLPEWTELRIGLSNGDSFRATVARLLDSSLLGEMVARLRIQVRLASLQR